MTDPSEPKPDCAHLEGLLESYKDALETGHMEDVESAMLGFLSAVAGQVDSTPTPQSCWQGEAKRCETDCDWAGAEAAYRQVLALAEAEDDNFTRYRAHSDLARLWGLLGRHEAALIETRAAVAVARPTDLPTLLHMALGNQAHCALRGNQVSEALASISESLGRMDNGALYNLQRGQALTVQAVCRIAGGDLSAAERDLEASWALLEPQATMAFAAGVQRAVELWWTITARLRAAQGDATGAVQAWQEAVARSRQVAALPMVADPYSHSALARKLLGLGQALLAAGAFAPAMEALTESRSLRQALGLPPFAADEPTI